MNKSIDTIPERYRQLPFDEYVARARNLYTKGEIIEAFVVLHGVLEVTMLSFWSIFVANVLGKLPQDIQFVEWEYNELVKLYYEFNLITDSQRDIFLDFRKGRNEAVHYLGKYFNSKIKMKSLNQRFKKGLKAWDIIQEIDLYGIQ